MRWLRAAFVLVFFVPTTTFAQEEFTPTEPEAREVLTPPPIRADESDAGSAGAGEAAWKKNSVTLQPLLWAFGYYSGNVEYAFSEQISLDVGISLIAFTGRIKSDPWIDSVTAAGLGVQPGIHYFLHGRAPEGLWIGPRVLLQYLSFRSRSQGTSSDSSASTSGLVVGLSALAGYTVVFGAGFTVTGGLGLGFTTTSMKSKYDGSSASDPIAVGGSFGKLSLGFGWTF